MWCALTKDGVKHPDLDKAWTDYDAAVAKVTESIKAAIAKQFDAATAKGDLDAAEKWQVIGEKFEKAGELPTDKEAKTAVSAAVADYKKAREELTKVYEAVVKNLTMEKKIAEAKAVRNEMLVVSTAKKDEAAPPAAPEGGGKIHRGFKEALFLSDLEEQNPVVGWGAFGKNGDLGYGGLRIMVGGVASPKGLSMHAKSNSVVGVHYAVPRGFTHFEAVAAINDAEQGHQATAVVFRVMSGNTVLWESKPLRGGGSTDKCSIGLKGAQKITLLVECPGDFSHAQSVWCDPKFLR